MRGHVYSSANELPRSFGPPARCTIRQSTGNGLLSRQVAPTHGGERFSEGDELETLVREAETSMQRLVLYFNSATAHKSRHRKRTDMGELP